jgi:hypothetical protein
VVVNLTSVSTVETVTDCFGAPRSDAPGELPPGLHYFPLPRGGSCVFQS